uniref:Uncharacterized protein n=1 Tax=Avena sativa TaxID=4498 RepID=A0ACD5XKY0_AVESA
MDPRRPPPRGGANGNGFSYSNLFNLEPLLNFKVPLPEDLDRYGNSSPNGSTSSQGQASLSDQYNGVSDASHGLHRKRKRHPGVASDDEEADDYSNQITEEHYRTMLSEHVQKYRRSKVKDGVFGSDPPRADVRQIIKHKNDHTRVAKYRSDFRDVAALGAAEASPVFNGAGYLSAYGGFNKIVASLDSSYLDMGDNVSYLIPEGYDKLASSLNLPVFSDIRVEEHFLNGTLDLRTLSAMLGTDRKFEATNRGGLAEPQPQHESLQERVKMQKFALQVTEDPFAIPEGSAGRIRRSIISESGSLQVHYVKVLEKGDTYEIIERSLPKKQILKKEHSEIAKEDLASFLKRWQIIARNIPKHHRNFAALLKRRQMDAKRFSENCQREVKLKVSRSLKLMRSAPIRTRKLARDMLIFWKRVDKEQYELRKKEERDAAEALKREEELREAKRHQQRLNFLISQTELYSHFMQNKAGESALPDEGSVPEDDEEEDPEEAELKREALRAAQHAVSQQKRMTNAFDSEIVRLCQSSDPGIICNREMPLHGCGFQSGYFNRLFNIFLPSYIHKSAFPESTPSNKPVLLSGAFGFTRLTNLSPVEASFLATCPLFEKLAFSATRCKREYVDEIVDLFINTEGPDLQLSQNDATKVRAVTRLLLSPKRADSSLLRTKAEIGLSDNLCEALVLSHHDRLVSNIRLLRSTYGFIPPARAPPINVRCSDRNFAYKLTDEMHDPWIKKLFLGFARTSEFNGPREPNVPNPMIQEVCTVLPIPEPILQLPYRIFGSSPPMSNFDPAKMLTDSGKLHTLDKLLRQLRAENHRVLLFAQMTKMLDILEDYMNFRKFKYSRLDGSSAISDRRDMVRNFQNRNDIFVFLLSTRAGGLGINLTAADTVIFYEIDWNPTQDQQAMDRTHRLGQTKEVTVYRLICKDTIEEKILQRAKQKNAVQELVMKGKQVQDDHLMRQEDAVSLLLDDTQIAHKLKEISMQVIVPPILK